MSDFKIGDTVYYEQDLGYNHPRTVVGVYGEFLWLDSPEYPSAIPSVRSSSVYRLKPKVYADGTKFKSYVSGAHYEVKRSDVVGGKVYYTLYVDRGRGLEMALYDEAAVGTLKKIDE